MCTIGTNVTSLCVYSRTALLFSLLKFVLKFQTYLRLFGLNPVFNSRFYKLMKKGQGALSINFSSWVLFGIPGLVSFKCFFAL